MGTILVTKQLHFYAPWKWIILKSSSIFSVKILVFFLTCHIRNEMVVWQRRPIHTKMNLFNGCPFDMLSFEHNSTLIRARTHKHTISFELNPTPTHTHTHTCTHINTLSYEHNSLLHTHRRIQWSLLLIFVKENHVSSSCSVFESFSKDVKFILK